METPSPVRIFEFAFSSGRFPRCEWNVMVHSYPLFTPGPDLETLTLKVLSGNATVFKDSRADPITYADVS
jgi:hypothetical protein